MTADWQTCGEAGYGSYGSYEQAAAARLPAPRTPRHHAVNRCSTVPGEDGRDSYGTDKDYYGHMAGIAQQQADHHAADGHENARAAAQHLADYYQDKANQA